MNKGGEVLTKLLANYNTKDAKTKRMVFSTNGAEAIGYSKAKNKKKLKKCLIPFSLYTKKIIQNRR